MKMLQVTAPTEFMIMDAPMPKAGPGEVLLRVQAVTICPQWDLHLRHNEPMFIGHQFHYPYTPGQPGHEATGYIEEVGAGVEGLAPGQRVSAWRDPGHDIPGCYAQYAVRQANDVIPVPEGLPDAALAPVELAMCVATVFRTIEPMDALRGRTVGVSGLGPAGLVAIQMAKAGGAARVIGFDLALQRQEMALSVGADACHDPRETLPEFPTWPETPQLQTSIDCVGSKASVEKLMDRTTDVLAFFGVQREDFIYAPRHAGLTLCGYKGHSRESAEYAVNLIRKGSLNLAPLVTHQLPLERYGEAVDLLEAQKAIKVCLLPWA